MAISWGSYDGHIRVGIDVSYDAPSAGSSTVQVTIKYYIGTDGWGFADNQALNYSGDFSGASTDYYNSGQTQLLVKTVTQNVSVSYGSTTGRSYTATVSGAYNGATPSKTVNITIPRRPYGSPSVPRNVAAANRTSSAITIEWDNPSDWGGSGEQEYDREWRQGTSGSWSSMSSISNRTWTRGGLNPYTQYQLRVRANNTNTGNGGGTSSWVTVTAFTKAGTPSVPRSVAISNLLSTSARATWQSPSDWGGQTGSYEYELKQGATLVQSGAPASSPIDFSGLTPGLPYTFRVRAYNDDEQSAWVEVEFTPPAGPQSAPVLSVASPGPTAARLDWTDIADWGAAEGTYTFKYGTSPTWDSGQTTVVSGLSGAAGASEYTIPVTLQPNTHYYAQVKGVNSYGDGPDSNTVEWDTSAPPVYFKASGNWRSCSAVYVKVSGSWRSVVRTWVKAGGVWR